MISVIGGTSYGSAQRPDARRTRASQLFPWNCKSILICGQAVCRTLSPCAPDQLGAEHIREYQLYLFRERKLAAKTVSQRVAALRFFFVKTLKRHHMLEHLPFPRLPEKLPTVLSREEVGRLLAASANRLHRTMLMTMYSTGVRRGELCQLQTSDIDSQRRSEEHTSELQSRQYLVCRLLLEKK